jgi:hypothetical protein
MSRMTGAIEQIGTVAQVNQRVDAATVVMANGTPASVY